MATILKMIRVALNLSRKLPEQILALGNTVLKGMTGNVNFPNPPVDLNTFKTALDALASSIVDAQDGGKKALAQRRKQEAEVIRMLKALSMYVELNCKDDMNTFLTSGFEARSTTRTPAQQLDQPTLASLEQGASGQFLGYVNGVRKAKHYDERIGVVGPGGATPTSWTVVTIPHAKTPALFNGLTPGTTYAVQVRAYGTLGYTEWSDSVTRMVI